MKNVFKKIFLVSACCMATPLTFSLNACNQQDAPIMGPILGPDTIEVCESVQLLIEILPASIDQTIVWTSDQPSIGQINKETGELMGIAKGNVTITAFSPALNISKTKTISIIDATLHAINISGESDVPLYTSDIYEYTATFQPSIITDDVTWSTSDEEIAIIDNGGIITPKSVGYVKIIATSVSNPSVYGTKMVYISEPEVTNWKDDKWQTIVYYANQGIDVLKEKYKADYESENSGFGDIKKIKNSFVGLAKPLEIKVGYDPCYHYAIVIGQEHDKLAGSNQKAALTFQFADVISKLNYQSEFECDAQYFNLKTWYTQHFNTWYVNPSQFSDLRLFGINYVEELIAKGLGFTKETSPIKKVEKSTLFGGKTEKLTNSVETVFITSLSEVYSYKAISATDFSSQTQKLNAYADKYALEGTQYEFYAHYIKDTDPENDDWTDPSTIKDYSLDTRKTLCKSEDAMKESTPAAVASYWLRTPFIYTGSDIQNVEEVIYISNEGNILCCNIIDEGQGDALKYGFCPCFCL